MFSDKYMGTEYKRDKVLNKKMRYKEAIQEHGNEKLINTYSNSIWDLCT